MSDDNEITGAEMDDSGASFGDGGDSTTEISHESWFSRIGKSVMSVVIGFILFVVAFPLLWWNEGRALRTAQGLAELGGQIVSIVADKVDPANDKKPVHLSAEAQTDETLLDGVFPVSATAIKLRRVVEMYQWDETKKSKQRKQTGGGSTTETTYTYRRIWHEGRINSNNFHNRGSHSNPDLRLPIVEHVAKEVRVGAFRLSPALTQQINSYETLPFAPAESDAIPAEIREQMVLHEGWLYLPQKAGQPAASPNHPAIGDVRIRFEVVKPSVVSVAAQQYGNTFDPWHSHSDTTIERLMPGNVSATEMIHKMEVENNWLTWGLRLLGFAVMAGGIAMCLSPLQVFADVLPFVGNLVGMGTALFAAVAAASLSLLTISIAWFAYRPLLSMLLIVGAVAIVVFVRFLRGRSEPPLATVIDG